jgi:2-hydroxychromene-2-carboxylate isomerase
MSVMPAGDIELFFDFVSPYSYLAWHKLPEVAARHERTIVPRPMLFAAVLQTLGTRGPAEVPMRRAYIVKDLVRRAHALGVPFTLPPAHPFNPLLALRVAVQPMPEEVRLRVVTALFDAIWRTGAGVEGAEAVARALAPLGVDSGALLSRAGEDAVKAAVRANSDEFIAAGGFGVPTMRAGGELFFGSDSLPFLDAFLSGKDPATSGPGAALVERWHRLPATAKRSGT